MSKELNFADGYDEVKYLDNSTNFDLILTENNIAFDLSRADAISIKIGNDDGYIMEKDIDPKTITNYQSGEIIFPIDDSIMNTLVPDDYYIEVWLKVNPVSIETDSESATFTVDSNSLEERQSIFPSTGLLGFTIDENISSTTGEVIPTITFDQFKSQFNDMMAQMDNVVHNIQKGDKGDKGDTGQGLEIKDKVSNISNLPSTGNEGDGYLVGEELYVWISGSWKDCGSIQGPQGIQGIQGEKGDTGNGISSTTIQYQISNSATNTPTGTWSNNIIATTQNNPYLWLQATLNYTDGTKKIFYLVSTKGDKGGKGDQGIQGVQGPKGDTGAGLQVKGKVNNVSQLPTTGQDGYCYFVGTDMYVWTDGKWNNMGDISPDLSNYVTLTDMNSGLATKVTDNKDGTEQLNGVQVQPFNKLSDTIGGRNLLINTAQLNDSTVCLVEKSNISDTYLGLNIYQTNTAWDGIKIYWSYLAPKLKTNTNYIMSEYVRNTSPTKSVKIGLYGTDSGVVLNSRYGSSSFKILPSNSGWTRIYALVNIASFPTTISSILRFENATPLTDGYVQFAGLKFEQGSVATDWTPAPEDKVNVSDMRKPASDVAGIEEVNAKQDKLTYTPADDSKVAHLSGDETIDGQKKFKIDPTDTAGNAYAKTVDVNQQLDKKVNTADMRKPASDVAGIEEVNAKQDKIGYTPADDSKVVHDNHDGTIQVNGDSFTPALLDSAKDKNSQPIDTDVNTLVKPGLYYVSGSAPNNPFKMPIMLETKIQYDSNGFKETQISYELDGKSEIATRYVVPNGDLTESYGESAWVFLSDDSKVAHLSGANNFDTVPTVNNKSMATTDDVTTASNTVLTSANTSISKLLQQSSSNSEDSATTDSTSDTSNFYYWTE